MRRIISIFLIACIFMVTGIATADQQNKAFKDKIKNIERIMKNQPATALDFSMDRYLLDERNKRFNDPNKMTYLYVFFNNGETMQVTIIGKLASTSKRLSSPVQNYRIDRGEYYGSALGPAPDDMAVYGESSGGAKAGLTTLGSFFEMGGFFAFIYSEVPLVFSGIPEDTIITVEAKASDAEKARLLRQLETIQNKGGN